jgi:hypothetical protein
MKAVSAQDYFGSTMKDFWGREGSETGGQADAEMGVQG